MSSSLLQNGSSNKGKKPPKRYSLTMASLSFGVEDKVQLAVQKAVFDMPGLPKKKHVNFLIENLCSGPDKWESILLFIDALSNWRDSRIVTCKVLTTVLLALQVGPAVCTTKDCNLLKILTNSIEEKWATTDLFLTEFALFLHQRISFLEDNPSFNEHFNLRTFSSNGHTLPPHDHETVLAILSKLLNFQQKIVNLLKMPFNRDVTAEINKNEEETYRASVVVIYEDAFCVYVAVTSLLQFVIQHSGNNPVHTPFSAQVVSALVEQYNDLFDSFSANYYQLLTADSDLELSSLPERSPFTVSVKYSGGGGGGSNK